MLLPRRAFFFGSGRWQRKHPVMSAENPWDPGHHLTKPFTSLIGHESLGMHLTEERGFSSGYWLDISCLLGHICLNVKHHSF